MRSVRLKQMEQFIIENNYVTIQELCDHFKIHINTCRSDINTLVEKGIITKEYGGVSASKSNLPTTYSERMLKNIVGKKQIALKAAQLLEEGDVIYVDTGSTAAMLLNNMEMLPSQLTVITSNLYVINWCVQNSPYTVFALPGKLDKQLYSFSSLETIESVKAYNIHKAFFGARGISLKGDLTSASAIDAKVKSTVIKNSQMNVLMAASDKINHAAMINFAHMNEFDCWVTDCASEDAQAMANSHGIQLISADDANV